MHLIFCQNLHRIKHDLESLFLSFNDQNSFNDLMTHSRSHHYQGYLIQILNFIRTRAFQKELRKNKEHAFLSATGLWLKVSPYS